MHTFFQMRNQIIDRLEAGMIDKKSFLQENLQMIDRLQMKPYVVLDSVERCIYNYQYYNVLAKYCNSIAQAQKKDRRGRRVFEQNIGKMNNYYELKDQATIRLLELLEDQYIEAYPLVLNSVRLKDRLFEIRVTNRDRVILHSMKEEIRNSLVERGVYHSSPKKSIIDGYVNTGY